MCLLIFEHFHLERQARPPIMAQPQLYRLPPVISDAHAHHATMQNAFFTHTMQNKANSIQFAYQALCSPRISTLLKAILHGYLKGCPNMMAHGVSKYLNPSPATAKGHMKRPCQGILSKHHVLTPATSHKLLQVPLTKPTRHEDVELIPLNDIDSDYSFGFDRPTTCTAMIKSNKDSKTNIFCFATFADKHMGIVYGLDRHLSVHVPQGECLLSFCVSLQIEHNFSIVDYKLQQ